MLGKKMEIWWASEISFSCPLSTICMSESVSFVIACSRSSDSGVQHKIRKQEKNKKEKRERVSSVNRCQSSNGYTPHCLLNYFKKYAHETSWVSCYGLKLYSGKNLSSLFSANKLKYPLVLKMKELNIPLSLSVIFSPITWLGRAHFFAPRGGA